MPLDETPDTNTVAPPEPTQPYPADINKAACREPNWDELTDSQKIERLRGVVKFLDQRLAEERVMRHKLVAGFVTHRHLENGAVVVPVDGGKFHDYNDPFELREDRGYSDRWI